MGPKYLPPGPATTLATLAKLLHCRLPPSPNTPVSDLCLFHISLLEGSSPSQACPTYVTQLISTRVSCRKYSRYDNCVPGGALSVSWGLHMTSMPRASKPLLPSHVSASGRKPWCHFFQTSVELTKRPCTYQVADKETCTLVSFEACTVPASPFSHPGLLRPGVHTVQIGGLIGMNSKSFWAIQWPFGQLIEAKLEEFYTVFSC